MSQKLSYPILGTDLGNKDIKAILNSLRNTVKFPNVLAPMSEKRDLVDEHFGETDEESKRDKLLGNLHFYVESDALSPEFNKKVYGAGRLAMEQPTNWETRQKTKKYNNDQILIMGILTAAIQAVEYYPTVSNLIYAYPVLSTSLPVDEADKNIKEAFKSKFKNSTHKIKFLDVPNYQNITIYINFVDVYVPTECVAGIVDLSIPEETNRHVADPNLLRQTILVPDLGGGTFDELLIQRGTVKKARTHKVGINEYLGYIMDEFEKTHDFAMSSREKLVERMTATEHKYEYKVYGEWENFEGIANNQIFNYAQSVFTIVDKAWKSFDDLDITLFIGGGSIPVKPNLKTLNQKYKFKFIDPIPVYVMGKIISEEKAKQNPMIPDPELVIYLNARGNYKIAKRQEQKKKSRNEG